MPFLLLRKFASRCFLAARTTAIFILCISTVFLHSNVSAQASTQKNFLIERFDDVTGLPQNSVRQLEMDREGFMWIATEQGLVRFDGQHFRNYNSSNAHSITSDRIQTVINLLGKLYLIDGNDRFSTVNHERQTIEPVTVSHDKDNVFNISQLLGLEGADSLRLSVEDIIVTTQFKVDSTHYYLVREARSIYYIDHKRLTVVVNGSKQGIGRFFFLSGGSLFSVNNDNSLMQITNGKITKPSVKISSQTLVNAITKNDVHGSKANVYPGENACYIKLEDKLLGVSIQQNKLVSNIIFEGMPEGQWMAMKYFPSIHVYAAGTLTKGLMLIRPKMFTTVTTTIPGLENNNMYAQVLYKDSIILTANGTGFYPDGTSKKLLPDTVTTRYGMFLDAHHHIYASSNLYLTIRDSALRIIKTFTQQKLWEMRGFYQDHEGSIWFGKLDTLWQIKNDTELIAVTNLLYKNEERIIESIFEYQPGMLWIGTRRGLFRYQVAQHKLEPVPEMENSYVRTMYKSGDGSIWIGTYGHGFFLYRNGAFIKMPVDKSGSLLSAHCFVEDKNGFLWIPTNKGLFQVYKSDLYNYADNKMNTVLEYCYDKKSGLLTNEFNGGCTPCSVMRPDSTISFPSLEGLVWFNPNHINPALPRDSIFIDDISVDSTEVQAENLELALKPLPGITMIHVSTPYYGDPKNLDFEYRMQGIFDSWRPVEDNKIIITKPASGRYVLEIRKRNGFGLNNYSYKTLTIIVSPKWFETWWFIAICSIASVLLLMGGIALRTKYLNKQKNALEKMVMVRTAELQTSNWMKDRLTSVLAHDLKSPLRFITSMSSRLYKKVDKEEVPDTVKEISLDLMNATREVYSYIDEFVLWVKSKQENFTLQKTSFSLLALFGEFDTIFSLLVKGNNNTFSVELTDDILVNTDREILKLIIRNLLDNSNKYTMNGAIHLSATKNNNHVHVVIKDSGMGMSPEQVGILEGTLSTGDQYSSGLGFKIINDFARQIGASISVKSELQKGTSITISLPSQ